MERKKATKAPAPSKSTVESSTTKTTSTTSSGFALQCYKNGMRDTRHSKPPTNLENPPERYARSHTTASPPDSEYKRYFNNVGNAANKATMVVKVSGYMLKVYDDPGYLQPFNQPFTAFPADVACPRRQFRGNKRKRG
ncbi:hypothetical protein B0T18DRAFT_87942 [Schizothecium vesticola]|uniref:Uncharacterized protein n=1 Tax=Schizothecium vesticola TaxID=314040 RepID=A0AA40F6Y6_9PEZI|nr:hypothetical protein B0T18DRAFT_87942 [Schizothecium vesticola]